MRPVRSVPPLDADLLHRFLAKIDFDTPDGCWEWQGARQTRGYGCFGIGPRTSMQTFLAHRLSYEWLVGPIPCGLTVDHTCCNKACVNPDHLEPVTHAENNRRGGLAVRHLRRAA